MKGKQKALENQALTIAREMKLEVLSTLLISKTTALSTKEIQKL